MKERMSHEREGILLSVYVFMHPNRIDICGVSNVMGAKCHSRGEM